VKCEKYSKNIKSVYTYFVKIFQIFLISVNINILTDMQAPKQIMDIVNFPGKQFQFAPIDSDARLTNCGTLTNMWPGDLSDDTIMVYRQDIEDYGFICFRIRDDQSEWVIWDPEKGDPRSAFKKHRRSQSDQKVSKKRSKNKKTKRSGKKRSTRKTSKRRV